MQTPETLQAVWFVLQRIACSATGWACHITRQANPFAAWAYFLGSVALVAALYIPSQLQALIFVVATMVGVFVVWLSLIRALGR